MPTMIFHIKSTDIHNFLSCDIILLLVQAWKRISAAAAEKINKVGRVNQISVTSDCEKWIFALCGIMHL